MATRTHRMADARLIDGENLTKKSGKAVTGPIRSLVSSRPALGELGNKVHTRPNDAAKKTTVMGPPQALPKNTRSIRPINDSSKENSQKKNEKQTIIDRNETFTKRNESITIKNDTITSKNETVTIKSLKISENIHIDEPTGFSTNQFTIIDPDASSRNEPQMVVEYLADIFSYLKELEERYPIREKYLDSHPSTPRMRAILVNWLVEVHMNFKLCLETLHMCISLVDRYLQDNRTVGRETLQLVGASALLVASKYEEMYIPELSDFVYICDDTFSPRQILQMEIDILKKLEFNLGRPLSVHFLRRYSKVAKVDAEQHTLGKYLLELALLDYDLCHIKPSIQAAAACCLSIAILEEVNDPSKIWTPTLVHYTTYKYPDFKTVVLSFANILHKSEGSKYQTIRKKYSTAGNAKISLNMKLKGPLVRKLVSIVSPK